MNVKWGIIGTGRIASLFAEALATIPEAILHSVASRNADTAKEFAAKYNVPNAVEGYENLVEGAARPDVVYVATPHTLHTVNTLMCLRAGVPVLCEKPLAANYGSVIKMVLESRDRNVFFMEAMWTRFLPSFLQMEKWINEGRIGDTLYLKADFGYSLPFDPNHRIYNMKLGGGALLDVGVYPLFLSRILFGQPTHLQAAVRKAPTGADAHTALQLGFENNKIAHLSCSVDMHTEIEATVYGSKGRICLKGPWYKPGDAELYIGDQLTETFINTVTTNGYDYEAREVMKCLKAGQVESELYPHRYSLEIAETVEKIKALVGLEYEKEY